MMLLASVLSLCLGLSLAQTPTTPNPNCDQARYLPCVLSVEVAGSTPLFRAIERVMANSSEEIGADWTDENYRDLASRMNHTRIQCPSSVVYPCFDIPERALMTRAMGHFGTILTDPRLNATNVKKLVDCNQRKEWMVILGEQMFSVIYAEGLFRPNTMVLNDANFQNLECRIYNQFTAKVSADSIGTACGEGEKKTFSDFVSTLGNSYQCTSGATAVKITVLAFVIAFIGLVSF
ncbi:uncharacterized protein LOC129584388 [Paramacrobiotus metropolitanus]|uniref:uncharacterized protein LOC129584388 n=1 Tax=Paramacrobiotus metropolitanus TaxID=2943436 RepID=UPI0024464C99|nr:uncharacterized protein LOC129584388 [Paramacrobiotus metropolitanus]